MALFFFLLATSSTIMIALAYTFGFCCLVWFFFFILRFSFFAFYVTSSLCLMCVWHLIDKQMCMLYVCSSEALQVCSNGYDRQPGKGSVFFLLQYLLVLLWLTPECIYWHSPCYTIHNVTFSVCTMNYISELVKIDIDTQFFFLFIIFTWNLNEKLIRFDPAKHYFITNPFRFPSSLASFFSSFNLCSNSVFFLLFKSI